MVRGICLLAAGLAVTVQGGAQQGAQRHKVVVMSLDAFAAESLHDPHLRRRRCKLRGC
jgi:hypothetical protein